LFVRSLCVITFLTSWACAFFYSPLLVNDPGFGAVYGGAGNGVDAQKVLAFGNWEYGLYHGNMEYIYRSLDSLYRQSYFEWGTQFVWKYLGLGAAYGLSMEWIPGQSFWTRHRYRGGLVGRLPVEKIQAGMWMDGFVYEEPSWIGALMWEPSQGMTLFGEFSPSYALLGYSLCFSYVCMESNFRAPGFAVEIAVFLRGWGWKLGGGHLFGGKDLDWNEVILQKTIKK